MKKHIPNSITLLNLFFGCAALISILSGRYTEGGIFVALGLLADFLDGAVARALGVSSPLGVQLDSLADMVSFGVVPGAIVFQLLRGGTDSGRLELVWSAMPAFLLTLFSCLRLAKFNLDTRQTSSFIGLATPANTVFFVGLMLAERNMPYAFHTWIYDPFILYVLTAAFSYFLVAEIPMFSFKKGFKDSIIVIFLILSVILLLFLGSIAFSIVILLYVIFNTVQFKRGKTSL